MAHEEYLRRNLVHASAVGSKAAFSAAINRLSKTKRPQKWLMAVLRSGLERAETVHPEVAAWRNLAPDAPTFMKSE